VEEERLRLEDGRPGRRRLTLSRTADEGSGEQEDGGGRRLRSDGQQRDARVVFGMDWGRGVAGGQIGKGNRVEVEARCQIPNLWCFLSKLDKFD
jgi:hypothetical protein